MTSAPIEQPRKRYHQHEALKRRKISRLAAQARQRRDQAGLGKKQSVCHALKALPQSDPDYRQEDSVEQTEVRKAGHHERRNERGEDSCA